ncbi:2-dehydropantoate 2-reductase [Piscibacillus halophilus]|uniref:2-dehydropantoate 2-reductase n=1 Tax=Piscibacillus halophilus TaxID=571933 RepID=UPI00158ADB31|nr:2-dehydropantoate 2-reductase [Piscibacillus halophilus]
MDIGVIGLGSVGLFIASQLSKRHRVTGYVRRTEQQNEIVRHGILLDDHKYEIDVKIISELKMHDLLIICVKQTQMDSLLPYIQNLDSTHILFIQNGLGHVEKVNGLNHVLFFGVCQHGVTKINDYQIRLNGLGQIRIGSDQGSKSAEIIQQQLDDESFPVYYDQDIFSTIQEKLVVNSVINPLTALFEIPNGEILKNSYLKSMAKQLTSEAAKAFSLNEERCWELVHTVAENTQENYSSMLVDLQQHRLTEIDYINGYIVKHSKHDVLLQHFMYQCIKAKEMNRLQRS